MDWASVGATSRISHLPSHAKLSTAARWRSTELYSSSNCWHGNLDSTVGAPPPFLRAPGRAERINRLKTLKPGQATGRLIGGNLSLITHLLGTPYAPDFRGAILFLEDVDEAPYRIDRMLTALWLAGVFDQIAGLVIGKFTNAQASGPSLSIDTILNDRVAPLSIPVLQGLMIGHIEDQATLPVGAMATLDADRQQLTVVGPYLV